MSDPVVAVVLPVYNGGALLREAVESVLNQTMSSFEFVICDDCSNDESGSYLRRLRDHRVTVLSSKQNMGLFPTLNELLGSSNAPLIHLWSQDDVMYPDCLQETVAFHAAHPEVGMSWCQFDLIDERGTIANPDWNSYVRPEWLLSYELYAELSLIWGCLPYNIANVSLARTVVEEAGFFREDMTYSGDFEYWGRVARVATVGRIGKKLIQLRAHAAQASAQLSARVRNVTESLEVSQSLLAAVRPSFEAEMRRCFHWKTVPAWAMTFWLCLRAKKWGLARDCWRRTGSVSNFRASNAPFAPCSRRYNDPPTIVSERTLRIPFVNRIQRRRDNIMKLPRRFWRRDERSVTWDDNPSRSKASPLVTDV